MSCNTDDDNNEIVCTQELRPSFLIEVRDTDNTNLSGVTVTVIDGDFEEVLEEFPSNPNDLSGSITYSGVFERPGIYIITAALAGFQTFTSDAVTVEADACHVITEELIINLDPN